MASETSRRLEFKAGQRIFAEGDPPDYCYQVFRGRVHIVLQSGGRPEAIASIGPGEVFGEMGIIDSGPRSASAIAAEDTVCIAYSSANIFEQLEKNPATAIEIMKTLVRRLRYSNRRFGKLEVETPVASMPGPDLPPPEGQGSAGPLSPLVATIRDAFGRFSARNRG